ncbi:TPA: hypothetical protein N0F65_007694 [Lagenidium giganteum]|uniref:WW domain-containing protein n=1 Tax=Lagenidium giganteum TaxID=4803 RepID=A0AAV2Z4E5_9STRA|nr:TPA: hypothetical protein N0F65_007694 [Lagenidium giganteum]
MFERQLDQAFCKEKSIATITRIFSKLQHRLMYAGFVHWHEHTLVLRKEALKAAALERSKVQAFKFFEKLASDAYVGTIDKAFRRWAQTCRDIIFQERTRAATKIQTLFRTRRAKMLLSGLKQASLDRDFRRKVEIQQLLKFETYGTIMKWSTLRMGFDLVLQNHCSRIIQFFFRRFLVACRALRRRIRKNAAIRIQCAARRKAARAQLEIKRELKRQRDALERASAIEIQRHGRGLLSKQRVKRIRAWKALQLRCAFRIQTCWRKCKERRALQVRFELRKRAIAAERRRLELIEIEKRRQKAALDIQRMARGLLGRLVFKRALYDRKLDRAARRLQVNWRRSKGRYALHLRFLAQRARLDEIMRRAATRIQGRVKIREAKKLKAQLKADYIFRCNNAITIQRRVRGWIKRRAFKRVLRAVIKIECFARRYLARMEVKRRRIAREELRQRREAAALKLQSWARGLKARQVSKGLKMERDLKRASALMIQRRVRGMEVRRAIKILKTAMELIDIEQKRMFFASARDPSPLLTFMTTHYMESPSNFTSEQLDWLEARVHEAQAQLAKENAAVTFLQRHYRGYMSRMAFWAMKCRVKARKELERHMATHIQRVVRGHQGRRQVQKMKQKSKMDELKLANVRERKYREQEIAWREKYQREQTAVQMKQAKDIEQRLKDAKRDAELAKWHADTLAFKKQELQEQKQIDKMLRIARLKGQTVDVEDDDDDDAEYQDEERNDDYNHWQVMQDENGYVYYFHTKTGESSWTLPDHPPDDPEAAAERAKRRKERRRKRKELEREQAKAKRAEAAAAALAALLEAENRRENTPSGSKGWWKKAEPEEVVPEGMCWKCKTNAAVKECLGCSDPKRRMYCLQCFVQEHLQAKSNKQRHDFRVLIKQRNPACCLSATCLAPDKPAPNLATYFCGQCKPNLHVLKQKANVIPQPLLSLDDGCYYCEECFPGAHETAEDQHHIPDAMHFKTGALLCSECNQMVATRQCDQCDEQFCNSCFDAIHAHSVKKGDHSFTLLEIIKDDLPSEKDAYCSECDVKKCTKMCNLCGDGFCDRCFDVVHVKGRKQHHTAISWESFTQVGDWLEVFDEKTNVKLYFNIETKESTNKQPFILKSGEERHHVQFIEKEQMMKRKEIELESTIIKLSEEVRGMKEQEEALKEEARKAMEEAEAIIAANSKNKKGKRAKLKSERGILAIFRRRRKKKEQEMTLEQKKRQELLKSIDPEDKDTVAGKLRTADRAAKEKKERETFGTKLFEQSIVNDLVTGK